MQDKTRIDEISSYAVGRDVPVVDAFRLGKQKCPVTDQSVEDNIEIRPRPVLVKLGCVWDCLQNTNCEILRVASILFVLIRLLISEQKGGDIGWTISKLLLRTND